MSRPTRVLRDSPILDAILVDMRSHIVSGAWAPGSRLKTQDEYIEAYRTSKATMQRAYNVLFAEGLIDIRGSAGTYVAVDPFALYTCGIVFPNDPLRDSSPGMFDYLLAQTWSAIPEAHRMRLRLYVDVTGHSDDEGYRQAAEDVCAHRLAGLFIPHRQQLQQTPIMTEPGIPRVTIGSEQETAALPALIFDETTFIDKALDYLHACGRRRIAVIYHSRNHGAEHVLRAAAARGLTMHPYWTLMFTTAYPDSVINPVRLLMGYPPNERPDGLLIWDDLFVAPVLTALHAAGFRVGEDVDLIAHCNFPQVTPDTLPIKRLGTAVPLVVTEALAILHAQRQGRTPPAITRIPAWYDDEFERSCE